MFGFDVLLDEQLRTWLIEVNTSPSLGTAAAVDRAVKEPMLASLMHMVGVVPYHGRRAQAEAAAAQQVQSLLPRQHLLECLVVACVLTSVCAQRALLGLQPRAPQCWPKGGSGALSPRDFEGVAPYELPDVVRESEAEWARRGAWQPCLPAMHDLARYLGLFESARREDVLLCKWLQHKAATRPATVPGPPAPCGSEPEIGGGGHGHANDAKPQGEHSQPEAHPKRDKGRPVRSGRRVRRASSARPPPLERSASMSAISAAQPANALPRATPIRTDLIAQ